MSVEQTQDPQTMAIQEVLRQAQIAVNGRGNPPQSSDAVTFTAGQILEIAHLLGRQPVEWSVVDVTGGYGSFQRISWDDRFIVIQSQNACTANFKFS